MQKVIPFLVLGLLAACANYNAGDNAAIKIETKSNGQVRITDTAAYRDGGHLFVDGILEYPPLTPAHRVYGQVTILVLAADGKVLARQNVDPKRPQIPRMSQRAAQFFTIFDISSMPGTIVRITFRDINHRALG